MYSFFNILFTSINLNVRLSAMLWHHVTLRRPLRRGGDGGPRVGGRGAVPTSPPHQVQLHRGHGGTLVMGFGGVRHHTTGTCLSCLTACSLMHCSSRCLSGHVGHRLRLVRRRLGRRVSRSRVAFRCVRFDRSCDDVAAARNNLDARFRRQIARLTQPRRCLCQGCLCHCLHHRYRLCCFSHCVLCCLVGLVISNVGLCLVSDRLPHLTLVFRSDIITWFNSPHNTSPSILSTLCKRQCRRKVERWRNIHLKARRQLR
mmetsp:Transcript_148/g.309  ORF Transcript_148/g.309 Transcript_148/m.309 type:complete len:258 (-) Transcript_148:37-810(-)